ncbi:glycosyltransferase family 25 protein [Rhizobium tubonense]|uniref:glycosyltransferase family 25 protein n=1 Tax=Rhizobium tubonense TaxID=484088 RepID=UPI001FCEBD06|nr:glycosyltransferase family 25 protein [Rhizobium tubonense]
MNLDRCTDRWQRLRSQAVQFGLNVIRIGAVDGRMIAEHERADFHHRQFVYHNGRRPLAGEYGCYRSHIIALTQFVASGDAMAIIMEDDIDLSDRLIPRAIAAMEAIPGAGLVKLVNHRMVGFRRVTQSAEKDVVGRCLHGPQGSAACYIVTRSAAERLLHSLRPMFLPYDVALERGWATGVETFSTEENIADFSPYRSDTTIGKRSHYRAVKKHFVLRASAHWFRTHDQVRRWFYALRASSRSRR